MSKKENKTKEIIKKIVIILVVVLMIAISVLTIAFNPAGQ